LTGIEAAIQRGAWQWSQKPVFERCNVVRKIGRLLLERQDEYAGLITQEMHKPISQALAEVRKCATVCDYYADVAEDRLKPNLLSGAADETKVSLEPLGTILGVMPWNFPFWQVLRCATPIMLTGNGFLLKHAPSTLLCADAIEKLFLDAGVPVGSFKHIRMGVPDVHKWIASPVVSGVTFTGSTAVGSKIAESAGRHIKKVVLELGGSDAFVVCRDADIDHVAGEAVKARFQNCGQSCIAAKRFLVHEDIYEEFLAAFSSKAQEVQIGDPFNPDTFLSGLARIGLKENLHRTVEESVAQGANVYWQHSDQWQHDNFYPPTILSGIKKTMPVFTGEVFGPVAPVMSYSSEAEAIALANATEFGLGGSVWSSDKANAMPVLQAIESGSVAYNTVLHSHPAVPFGGIKRSGIGRELGDWGLWEFANFKVYHLSS